MAAFCKAVYVLWPKDHRDLSSLSWTQNTMPLSNLFIFLLEITTSSRAQHVSWPGDGKNLLSGHFPLANIMVLKLCP